MRPHVTRLLQLIVISAVMLIPLFTVATSHADILRSFTEDFSTTQYKDDLFTTIRWDTVSGQLRLNNFGMTTGIYNTAGQANAVVVEGDHAFVADGSAGFSIIYVGYPTSPSLRGSVDTPGDAWGVALAGDYAFVADGVTGVQVIDISDLYNPAIAGGYDTPYIARGIDVAGDYAAVADRLTGVIFLDISNPASPTYVSTYATTAEAMSVVLDGDLAYVAARGAGLVILDITNLASPTLLGTYDTPGDCWGVAVDGDKVYLGDGGNGLHIIDVSDPTSPARLGGYVTDAARGVSVNGNMVFVANYGNTYVFDVEDPTNPLVEYVPDTWGIASGTFAAGELLFAACGEDGGLFIMEYQDFAGPFYRGTVSLPASLWSFAARDDYIYVANRSAGLSVVDVSDPDNPLLLQSDDAYTSSASAQDVVVAGDYLYLANSTGGSSGALHVFSLSDPSLPQEVAELPLSGEATSIALDGDVLLYSSENAYAASCSVFVIDIADPENPVLAGAILNEYNEFTAMTIKGDYAYLEEGTDSELLVVDVSNPFFPVRIDSIALPPMSGGYGMCVAGDYLYVAGGTNGVHVIDISDPAHPWLYESAGTGGSVTDLVVQGAFLFVANYYRGLQVMDIQRQHACILLETLGAWGAALSIAASGEHVFFDNAAAATIESYQVFERTFDADANEARSLVVAEPADFIVRGAVTATPNEGVKFELSANDGSNWSSAGSGTGFFYDINKEGTKLMWRSTHTMTGPTMNPVCSEVHIDWLYRFAMIDSIVDVPGDDGGWARIHFTRSGYDFQGESSHPVTGYSIFRRIDSAAAAPAEYAGLTGSQLTGLPPGEWETVGYVAAQQEHEYICLVPTVADSAAPMQYSVYCILASTTTPSTSYVSYSDSGYSVDNLPPPVPSGFTVFYGAYGNTLAWGSCTPGECAGFRVYRGLTENFIPGPENLMTETTATAWHDTTDYGWSYHYKLTALDDSENESEPALPDNIVGAGEQVMPIETALHQNVPNPFNPFTIIRFDLPEAAPVRIEVFDVLGRSVRVLLDDVVTAGRQELTWDGTNSYGQRVASGVYLCRMKSGEFVKTMRMTLVK